MHTLLIRGELFSPLQHIYIFENNNMIEKIGIEMDYLEDAVFAAIEKYNIKHINLSGAYQFMHGIENKLKHTGVETYSLDDLTFKYV